MSIIKVIKIGGNIIDDQNALQKFLTDFSSIKTPKILVHGGGKLATKLAKKMGIEVKMKDGRRITDSDTLDIITMVYAGKINKNIIAELQSHQCNCIGFTGADGNSIVSQKRLPKPIDFGYVGDVEKVNTSVIELLIQNNITPIFSAITHNQKGQLLNTNADTIAAELSIALAKKHEVELYYCFEKNGLLENIEDENSVIESVNNESYPRLLKKGIIADGMLPKTENCIKAVNHRVSKVYIGKPEMLFTKNNKHTTFTK